MDRTEDLALKKDPTARVRAWLQANGHTIVWLEQQLCVGHNGLIRWLRGESQLSYVVASRLVEVTAGLVEMAEVAKPDGARHAGPHPGPTGRDQAERFEQKAREAAELRAADIGCSFEEALDWARTAYGLRPDVGATRVIRIPRFVSRRFTDEAASARNSELQ